MTQEYGLNLVIDYLIYCIDSDSLNDEEQNDFEIHSDFKELLSKTNKLILNLYLLKLLYLHQTQNFSIYKDYEKYLQK